jgi:hypothetical protein
MPKYGITIAVTVEANDEEQAEDVVKAALTEVVAELSVEDGPDELGEDGELIEEEEVEE